MNHRDECPQCMALWMYKQDRLASENLASRGDEMNFFRELVKAWKWLVGKEQQFQVKPKPKRKRKAKR